MPVKLLQPVADLGAELLQPTDNELQVGLQASLGPRLFGLYFERVQSLLEAANAGLGFGLVEVTLGVPIDQACDALLHLGHLTLQHGGISLSGWRLHRVQPSLVLAHHAAGIFQQTAHFTPNRLLQPIGT